MFNLTCKNLAIGIEIGAEEHALCLHVHILKCLAEHVGGPVIMAVCKQALRVGETQNRIVRIGVDRIGGPFERFGIITRPERFTDSFQLLVDFGLFGGALKFYLLANIIVSVKLGAFVIVSGPVLLVILALIPGPRVIAPRVVVIRVEVIPAVRVVVVAIGIIVVATVERIIEVESKPVMTMMTPMLAESLLFAEP